MNVGGDLAKLVPGRVSTEVDARLAYDTNSITRKVVFYTGCCILFVDVYCICLVILFSIWHKYPWKKIQVYDLLKLYNEIDIRPERLLFKIPSTWQVCFLENMFVTFIILRFSFMDSTYESSWLLFSYFCCLNLLGFCSGNRGIKTSGVWGHTNTFNFCIQVSKFGY